jgi:hypothetical protein
MSVKEEIQRAVTALALPAEEFAAVPERDARALFDAFLVHFTGGVDARWWWEHFVQPTSSLSPPGGKGFTRISTLVPDPRSRVWFVAEDDQLPFYPVYDSTPQAAQAVIGECYAFEYYLIAKDLSWLLCENHHDTLIGVGDEVRRRLAASGA